MSKKTNKSSNGRWLEVTMEQRRLERQRRKQQREGDGVEERTVDSNDTFAYIAGYTSGGAPYGLTWEQWGGLEEEWERLEDADLGAAARLPAPRVVITG